MARPRGKSGSMWPWLLLIGVAGLAAGVGAAWLTGIGVRRSGKSGQELLADFKVPEMRMPELPLGGKRGDDDAEATALPSDAELAKLDRKGLESEVRRLHEMVALRDQQLADLQIQLKLLTDGSRTTAP